MAKIHTQACESSQKVGFIAKKFITDIIPSLTVEKQKNGCKASKINACSRFLFRNDMCYCAIFFREYPKVCVNLQTDVR